MISFCHIDRSQQAGFLGGTLTGVVVNISVADIVATVILSALGALISFLVSMALRRIFSGKAHEQPLQGEEKEITNG